MVNRLLEPHLSEVEQRFSVTLVAQICKGCVARFPQTKGQHVCYESACAILKLKNTKPRYLGYEPS